MKVTNTEHTATNGNHSKCRMAPFSCALCAFARVLSRRCLLLIALYISRQAAKVARTIFFCESPFSQMFMAWYISRQAAKVAKIICNTK